MSNSDLSFHTADIALAGREEEVEAALQSVTDPTLLGSIIVGPPGVGKSTLISTVLQRLGSEVEAIRVVCSELLSSRPYGALLPLLADVELPDTLNPLSMYLATMSVVEGTRAPARMIMVVENADFIDAFTASLISQLARTARLRVLIATDEVGPAVNLLAKLWTEGLLLRIDLAGLSEDAVRTVIGQLLGTTVTPYSASMLTLATGGNPRLLRILTEHQVETGALVTLAGVAMLKELPVVDGLELTGVDRRLERLDSKARDIVDLVALAGAVPYQTLVELKDQDSLMGLLSRGILRSVPGPQTIITLEQESISGIVAAQVPPARRRKLWTEFRGSLGLTDLPAQAVVNCAHWALSTGHQLSQEFVALAAREAFARGNYRLVLNLAELNEANSDSFLVELARTHVVLGNITQARTLANQLRDSAHPRIAEAAVVILIFLLDAQKPLPAEYEHLRSTEHSGLLSLALADFDHRAGRWEQAGRAAMNVFRDAANSASTRARAAALAGECLVVVGKVERGLSYAARATSMIEHIRRSSHQVQLEVLYHSFCATYLAGHWNKARDIAEAIRDIPKSHYAAQISIAVAELRCAKISNALNVLAPTLVELQAADPLGYRGLAQAAHTVLTRMQNSTDAIPEVDVTTDPAPFNWLVATETRFLQLLATGLHEPHQAARELHAAGEELMAHGACVPAIHHLIQAARFGSVQAAGQLVHVLENETGGLAELARCWGLGIVTSDAQKLLEAAECALTLGDVVLCQIAAEKASEITSAAGDRKTARKARSLAGRAFRLLRSAAGTHTHAGELTDFEKQVAHGAADGLSSAELGRRLHLSPRTVEWHLGKIYRRLRVTSRLELRQAVNETF